MTLSREGSSVRLPKRYEAFETDGVAELLKLNNLIVRRSVNVDLIYDEAFTNDIVAFAEGATPLLEFG